DSTLTVSNLTLPATSTPPGNLNTGTQGGGGTPTTPPATYPTPEDLSATIDWGDGTQTTLSGSPGITGGNGSYTVTAPHTYAAAKTFLVTVTLTDLVDGTQVSASSPVRVLPAPVFLFGNYVSEAAGQPFSGAVAGVYADPDMTDNSNSYQGIIDWRGGSSSTTATNGALGNGLYQVVDGGRETATAGLYTTSVKLASANLVPVVLALLPGQNDANGGLRKDVEGPRVAAGGGRYTYGVWFDATPEATVDVSNASWEVDYSNNNLLVASGPPIPVPGVKIVRTGLVYQVVNGSVDRTKAIGFQVTLDFPNTPVDGVVQLRGLVVNGQRILANGKRVVVVEVSIDRSKAYTQPQNFSATAGPSSIVLSTRPAERYTRDNLKSTENGVCEAELQKGLIGFEAYVTLTGAGADGGEGLSSIVLGWVQDISTTFKVTYARGIAQFVPTQGGEGPFLDATRTETDPSPYGMEVGVGGGTAFTNSSTETYLRTVRFTDYGKKRRIVSLDAPQLGFPRINPRTGAVWTHTDGGWSFNTYLTAFSYSDDKSYAVYARDDWKYNLVGTPDLAGDWARAADEPILKGG
ncbi:MAG TPA: hypothetical protein VFW33_19505, partial [Gemmataceae bacterium]|nr:hypothetical protein [Gemmataceae bacterium]